MFLANEITPTSNNFTLSEASLGDGFDEYLLANAGETPQVQSIEELSPDDDIMEIHTMFGKRRLSLQFIQDNTPQLKTTTRDIDVNSELEATNHDQLASSKLEMSSTDSQTPNNQALEGSSSGHVLDQS